MPPYKESCTQAPASLSSPAEKVMRNISFVICSIDNKKYQNISNRLQQCIDFPFEIIHINDAESLAEGYTRGLSQSKGDVIVFCHDDIDFLSDESFWPRLSAHLTHFDVVGVAGSSRLSGPMWMSGGPSNWAGMVIHHKPGANLELTIFDNRPEPIQQVQALDGVFLAMHREVAEKVAFDATTFDGFHGYDIDFTYRCYKAGYRLGACKDLLLIHESSGNFGEKWQYYAKRFINKFPEFSENSLHLNIRYSPCAIIVENKEEARRVGDGFLQGYIPPRSDAATSHLKTDPKYNLWKARKSLQEIDGQLLAEHMAQWKNSPLINIVIDVQAEEEPLLAETIDSIASQWYSKWHLTIISEFPPALLDPSETPAITWIQCNVGEGAIAFNRILNELPGEYFCFLEAGCTLEPHALIKFGDTINLHPNTCLLYCDEDRSLGEASTTQPHFKPDFNLELLRNTYYLGSGILLRRDQLEENSGLSYPSIPGLLDISLKIAEKQTSDALVHLPEILLHTPEIGMREVDPTTEQLVLKEHFNRQGIIANISDGLVHGTHRITYAPDNKALVSIIIPTRDQAGHLAHCLESLIVETAYDNFEIILIDHQSKDPDTLVYLQELPNRDGFSGRTRIIQNSDPFNYSALCNQGANIAKGEYLLFLDNDTEFIQKNWLSNLVGQIQQDRIAAVSPRLSCPDGRLSKLNQGPRILGMSGLAGQSFPNNTNLLEPGYFGSLQVAQEVSAVSGSCLMVEALSFQRLGGFDEKNTPIHESVLDLCLRIRAEGLKIIWTPWCDVVHRDKATRQRLGTQSDEQRGIEAKHEPERDYIIRKYLPQLANDPYYHRHLSLQEPYSIEPHAVIDWDTRFHDRLRILGTPLTSASGEYRLIAPFRALQKAGLAQCCQVHPVSHLQQRVINPIELARAAPDTLVVQQAIDNLQIQRLRQYREYNRDIFVTYAVDDIIGNLPKKHYLYNFQIREGKSRLREAVSLCDRLIVSTEPIADFCQGMIEDITIIPNCIEGDRWLHLSPKRNTGKKPRVGWAGAQQHLGDLEMIQAVVEATHKEVDWIFMGMCPDSLKPFVHEEHSFVPIAQYPAKLASLALDLAIAPLEQVIFNEGKSNLRLLEYGMMGWPVICTDIYPYRTNHAPVKRVSNHTNQWVEAIRERIYDLDHAAKEGQALHEWVLEHYLLENNLEAWLAAFSPGNPA